MTRKIGSIITILYTRVCFHREDLKTQTLVQTYVKQLHHCHKFRELNRSAHWESNLLVAVHQLNWEQNPRCIISSWQISALH